MDWRDLLVHDDAGLTRIFRESESVAGPGLKGEPCARAFYVPSYLKSRGYRIVPVNPTRAGERILGEMVAATLSDLPGPVDVVEVFRRPEFLPGHATEILRLPWKPAVVWFQLGIRHDA